MGRQLLRKAAEYNTAQKVELYDVHVEAVLNTSTVALRVVGSGEKGTKCLGV
jgi:hypothetical protein